MANAGLRDLRRSAKICRGPFSMPRRSARSYLGRGASTPTSPSGARQQGIRTSERKICQSITILNQIDPMSRNSNLKDKFGRVYRYIFETPAVRVCSYILAHLPRICPSGRERTWKGGIIQQTGCSGRSVMVDGMMTASQMDPH